jgi:glycosyltransferase involved in cell wall biosynthesis
MSSAVTPLQHVSPSISVIIPTYDRLPFLQEAVRSVEAQSLLCWELIVVDDGSTDGTWAWLASQPHIRAVRLPQRSGPAAARNRGAEKARAPYLAFLDSDDLFTPKKLELQLALLERDPELALCHSDELWLRDGKELRQKPKHEKRGGHIFSHCLPLCRISPSATLIRRSVFERLGGFDEELEVAEDYELWLRLTCRYPVGFIPEPLTIKRGGHPDQLSQKYGQIEKFRIEALRRVLVRAPLSLEQRHEALSVLRKKCAIYAQGCAKRGRLEEANAYLRLGEKIYLCLR